MPAVEGATTITRANVGSIALVATKLGGKTQSEKTKIKNHKRLMIFKYSSLSRSMTFFEVSKSKPFLANIEMSFL